LNHELFRPKGVIAVLKSYSGKAEFLALVKARIKELMATGVFKKIFENYFNKKPIPPSITKYLVTP